MKILHALPDVDSAAGGLPVAATRLAAAQAALGHQVTIATYRKISEEQRISSDLAQIPGFDRVHVEYLAPLTRGECLLGLQTRKQIDPLVRQFDIVHVHGVWDLLQRLTTQAARRASVPYVVAPHGMLDPWNLQQKKWKKKLALAMGYRKMLDEAMFLQALNEDEKRLLAPLGLKAPIRVIPNGIFLSEITDVQPKSPAKAYVLFLGRLHSKKGLDYLADAFALVAKQNGEVELKVVGPDGGAKDPFERQIAASGLSDRVHVLPPQYGREKWATIRSAAVFCLPSRQEGFSMAILESLACGVPAVVSEDCHFPEVAKADAGFVLPLRAAAFADAILALLKDPGRRAEMGRRGRQLVEQQFTWPRIAQVAIEAYASTGSVGGA